MRCILCAVETCIECAESWLKAELSKRYSYQEGHIYVVRRDKGENLDSDDEEPSKTDTVSEELRGIISLLGSHAKIFHCFIDNTFN